MKKLFLITAVATMFAACNNEELAPVVDEMTNTPIALHAGVAELVTRAGYPTGDLTSGSLGFLMATDGVDETPANSKYFATNKEFTYKSETEGWLPADNNSLLWKNATSGVNYIAYYPYSSAVANKAIEIEVPTTQTNENVVDFLCTGGRTKGAESASGINLKFDHMMTKLNITLSTISEFTTTPEFARVTIKGLKNKCKFKFNLYEKEPSYGWETPDPNLAATDVTMIKNSDNEFEAIVIPQKVTEFAVEIITTDNRVFLYNQSNVELAAGTAYTLELVVGKEKTNIKSATVAGWGSDSKEIFVGQGDTDEGQIGDGYTYYPSINSYFVFNAAGLNAVRGFLADNTTADVTLMDDIDLSKSADWTPIANYSGTFDGKGKSITGLKVATTGGNETGFIKNLSGTIKDLTIKSASSVQDKNSFHGIIVGKNNGGLISGCTVENSTLSAASYCGFIVGTNSANGTVVGCKVIDSSLNVGGYSGSVAGMNGSGARVIACLASGVSNTASGSLTFGGLVGDSENNAIIASYAYQCMNLSGSEYIVKGGNATVTSCYYTPWMSEGTGTLTAYDGTAATDWAAAVSAMNNAIDGATLPAGADKFHWGGTQSEPTLTKQ